MSEESIIKDLAVWLDSRKYPFRIPRAFIYGWESDYWCMTGNGETREFEIKVSRADYAIDKKKEKHADPSKGANYFYYVCPKGMIAKEEVFGKYGLIYVSENRLEVIKKPTKLNPHKFTQWEMLANKMYWKWYSLWYEKWKERDVNKLTLEEYRTGFNIDLENIESEKI